MPTRARDVISALRGAGEVGVMGVRDMDGLLALVADGAAGVQGCP
ncbi:hypothetical protein ABZ626_11330 [Streptomyces longispororuber]